MTEYDKGIISLAEQIIGRTRPESAAPLATPAPPPLPEVEALADRADASQGREVKTADELARMIEADLAKHPQCPSKGFVVTVYGSTLWRAMLTITPAAGPVRNPQEWRDLTEGLAERLRQRYDLAWR